MLAGGPRRNSAAGGGAPTGRRAIDEGSPRASVAVASTGAPDSTDGGGRTRLIATVLPLVKTYPGTQVIAAGTSLFANRTGTAGLPATSAAKG